MTSEVPADPSVPGPIDTDAAPAQAPERRPLIWVVVSVALGIVALDQVTKAWAKAVMLPRLQSGEGPIDVLGPWLRLTYGENTGAAFGIGTGFTWIFTAIAVIVAIVILRTSRKLGIVWWAVALGGLLGGAVGNLIDRLIRAPGPGQGYVVDFIALPNFPVFNVADMAITGSAILMILLTLRGVDLTGGRRV